MIFCLPKAQDFNKTKLKIELFDFCDTKLNEDLIFHVYKVEEKAHATFFHPTKSISTYFYKNITFD